MPFDKPTPSSCEKRGYPALLLAVFLVFLSVILGGTAAASFREDEEVSVVGSMMESEAVVAFLGLDGEE